MINSFEKNITVAWLNSAKKVLGENVAGKRVFKHEPLSYHEMMPLHPYNDPEGTCCKVIIFSQKSQRNGRNIEFKI